MSLLTDHDFLLRAFQLSYIRQVLPHHAPNSSRSGQGPDNLIKFSPTPSSYVSLSGLSNEHEWPELASGRSSPPLALALARESSRTGNSGRSNNVAGDRAATTRARRSGGPGLLGYTQTIVGKGSGIGGAGMRVDGVKRSWKGKGKLVGPDDDDLAANSAAPSSAQRLDSTQRHLAGNLVPPPVVVHSPVRTPRESPGIPHRPHHYNEPSISMLSEVESVGAGAAGRDPNATITAARKPRFSTSANEYHSYPDFHQNRHPISPTLVESPSTSLIEATEDYPSQPNSQVTDASSAFRVGLSAPASPASLPRPSSISPSPSPSPSPDPPQRTDAPLPPSTFRTATNQAYDVPSRAEEAATADVLASSDFPDGPLRDQDSRNGAVPISMASSGISLFGTSRLDRSTELSRESNGGDDSSDQSEAVRRRRRLSDRNIDGGGRPRTDSDFSLPSDPSLPAPAEPAVPAPSPANVPVFKLPPGMRVRERRRVNIKPGPGGALFVPNQDVPLPTQGSGTVASQGVAEKPDDARQAISNLGNALPSPQPSSPPQGATSTTSQPQRPPLSPSRTRKDSASLSRSTLTADAEKLAPPSPGSRSSRKREELPSPTLSFPKRSSYIRLGPPSPLLAPPDEHSRRSALTTLLTSPSSSSLSNSNPFSTLYAACVSRSASPAEKLTLTLFFPHCSKPGPARPIKVSVKRDVTVEEVIGVGLWSYWEEQEKDEREPKLDVDEEKAESGEETTKWNLRIVEDDGEVDEDFPALDRIRSISAFSFTEFAIVGASEQQVQDNVSKQATLTRRPSRILAGPKRVASGPVPISSTVAPTLQDQIVVPLPAASAHPNTAAFKPGSTGAPVDPLGVSSALAVPVTLKVELSSTRSGTDKFATVEIPSDMYLLDVLELVCRQRNLGNSGDWAFIVRLSDGEIVVPLDRTVESLGDQRELVLVSRSQVGTVGMRRRRNTQNINPAASIFQQVEEPSTPRYQSASQLTSTYQLYRVQRKLPMSLGGRHPRSIAIDGDYLHFMPADGKDSAGRTSSFHISLVQSCKVSRRSAASFKIVVHTKNRVDKRYDFEADSAKSANEIVDAVRTVMVNWRTEQTLNSRVIVGR